MLTLGLDFGQKPICWLLNTFDFFSTNILLCFALVANVLQKTGIGQIFKAAHDYNLGVCLFCF
jgi:hypothetical protein